MLSATFNIPSPPNRLPFFFIISFNLTAIIATDSNEETSIATRSNHLICPQEGYQGEMFAFKQKNINFRKKKDNISCLLVWISVLFFF